MGLFTTLISGTESAKDLPDEQVILFVDALKDVDTRSVKRIRAIFCREKGMNSHLEVICKIKGIPIIECESLDFVQGRHMEFEHERMLDPTCVASFQDFRGSFQVSVYD